MPQLRSAISLEYRKIIGDMKFLLISLGLVTLVVQIFCEDSAATTEIRVTNDLPTGTIIAEAQPVQEQLQTADKKLTKRSYGWEPWGWPVYGYGWPWPGWGGGHGGSGGGWYGGWYGGDGWPWWYNSHGGWHGKL